VRKVSFKEKCKLYIGGVNEKLGVKYPNAHKKAENAFVYFAEVWRETFPNNKENAKAKIDDRKERAKILKDMELKMKEMTPEQLDAYMQAIPEWKRGALVVTDQD
jgi:hypothetical protein